MSYEDIIDKKRPVSHHPRMKVSQRAKIFQPFAALTGYEEATAAKEHHYIRRIELSQERMEEINQTLLSLHKDDQVFCTYFVLREGALGEYLSVQGKIRRIDDKYHVLTIDDHQIAFEQLYDLKRADTSA